MAEDLWRRPNLSGSYGGHVSLVMVGSLLQNQAQTLNRVRMLDGSAMVGEKSTQKPDIVPMFLLVGANTGQREQERQRTAVDISPMDVDEESRPAPRNCKGAFGRSTLPCQCK